MTSSNDHAKEMVDDLVLANSSGNHFSHSIPNTWPIDAWLLLLNAHSDQWDTESLHCWIAHHAHAPEEVVRILASSPSRRVRTWIANKRNLPNDLFLALSHDDDETVRQAIARNKKTPTTIVELLKDDPIDTVRNIAISRLRTFGSQ